jgi:hypothetical protein
VLPTLLIAPSRATLEVVVAAEIVVLGREVSLGYT